MIEFGTTLRAAREAKGYTVKQLAEKTNILPSVIEALEREDFSVIAAPIYGRGFVRLCCDAIGLDPKPLVDEFMSILNGNREPTIRERAVGQAESPASAAESAVESAVAAPEPPEPQGDLFAVPNPTPADEPKQESESSRYAAPNPAPADEPELESESSRYAAPNPAPADEPARESEFSRYAAPVRADRDSQFPTFPWRLGVLAVSAVAVLVLLLFGIRTLYRATSSTVVEAEGEAPLNEAVAVPAAQDAAPRTQQKIPSLYID